MIVWIIAGYFVIGFVTSVITSLLAYEGDPVELGMIAIVWPMFVIWGIILGIGKIVRLVADVFRDKNISIGE